MTIAIQMGRPVTPSSSLTRTDYHIDAEGRILGVLHDTMETTVLIATNSDILAVWPGTIKADEAMRRLGYVVHRPLIYVAGPITGDPWGCVTKAVAVTERLEAEGFDTYLPQLSVTAEMVAPGAVPYEEWVARGLRWVGRCDGLWRIPGESPGADREETRAKALEIPIYREYDVTETPYDEWCKEVRRGF